MVGDHEHRVGGLPRGVGLGIHATCHHRVASGVELHLVRGELGILCGLGGHDEAFALETEECRCWSVRTLEVVPRHEEERWIEGSCVVSEHVHDRLVERSLAVASLTDEDREDVMGDNPEQAVANETLQVLTHLHVRQSDVQERGPEWTRC